MTRRYWAKRLGDTAVLSLDAPQQELDLTDLGCSFGTNSASLDKVG